MFNKIDNSFNNNPNFSDPVEYYPQEIAFQIFSYLGPRDIVNCQLVSKQWRNLANDHLLPHYALIKTVTKTGKLKTNFKGISLFGPREWRWHFGDIGSVPCLPKDIDKILSSPCPFNQGKKVWETHTLVLMPEQVNEKRLTLNEICLKIFRHPEMGKRVLFHRFSQKVKKVHGDVFPENSYWFLMAKKIIEKSRFKRREEQLKQVSMIQGYDAPSLLEATTAALTNYSGTGERMFPHEYTCCREQINNGRLVFGMFYNNNPTLTDFNPTNYAVGMAPVRKLPQ